METFFFLTYEYKGDVSTWNFSHVTTGVIILTHIVCAYVFFFLSFSGSGKDWDDTWTPAQQYIEPATSLQRLSQQEFIFIFPFWFTVGRGVFFSINLSPVLSPIMFIYNYINYMLTPLAVSALMCFRITDKCRMLLMKQDLHLYLNCKYCIPDAYKNAAPQVKVLSQ